MRTFLWAILVLGFAVGCGGAQSAESTTPTSAGSLNLPESAWARTDIPEAGMTVELPGAPVRQVQTNAEGRSIQYVVSADPLAVVVSVETSSAVIVPARETAVLDAVAELLVERARAPRQGCTTTPVQTIEHQGRPGRFFVSASCRGIQQGTLATAMFLHGSAIVTMAIVGSGLSPETLRPIVARVGESIEFGVVPSWFLPVSTYLEAPNVPGLSLAMPGQPELETTEEGEEVTARFTSEPITGLGAIVSVTRPASHALGEYCAGLENHDQLTLTARTGGVVEGSNLTFCEVRGRRASDPSILEIHDVFVVSGAVIELVWVGPYVPAFIAGGEAQLRDMRASIRVD